MCSDKNLFTDLNENFRRMVSLGNNTKMNVLGKGNVRLQVNGLTRIVSEVYFVPELKSKLLNLGQLQEKGLSILIRHGILKIYHPEKRLIM